MVLITGVSCAPQKRSGLKASNLCVRALAATPVKNAPLHTTIIEQTPFPVFPELVLNKIEPVFAALSGVLRGKLLPLVNGYPFTRMAEWSNLHRR